MGPGRVGVGATVTGLGLEGKAQGFGTRDMDEGLGLGTRINNSE